MRAVHANFGLDGKVKDSGEDGRAWLSTRLRIAPDTRLEHLIIYTIRFITFFHHAIFSALYLTIPKAASDSGNRDRGVE